MTFEGEDFASEVLNKHALKSEGKSEMNLLIIVAPSSLEYLSFTPLELIF